MVWSRSIQQLDKHKYFSVITLDYDLNKLPLDMPVKGAAFPSDLFSVRF